MSDPQFNSTLAVDVKAGFDATKLKGKSVLITGAASGLGEEMARQFVAAGAFVTIGDLSEERAASLADELGKDHCTFAPCDVTSWPSQLQLFKHALSASPTRTIDIVVANAGIASDDAIWKSSTATTADISTSPTEVPDPEEPDLSITKVNILGVHYTAQLAAHYLPLNNASKQDKLLIMTASLAGYLDMPTAPQYGASKWAVRGLMRSLRRTMPAQGIRCNIICPWYIRTPIMRPQTQTALQNAGIVFADKADAGKAVLHFSADSSIHGRALSILPREQAAEGYADLCADDFNEGETMTPFQTGGTALTAGAKAVGG